MAGFTMRVFTCIIFASLLLLVPTTEAITCGDVVKYLSPCIPYAIHGGMIPPACCAGVKGLNAAAQMTADRRVVCGCIKQIAPGVSGINYGLVVGIPGKCGVPLPFPVSPSINCNSIS